MMTRVLRLVREHDLLTTGDGVLVACSGGPDSIALLDVMARLVDRFALRLRVAYVHHGLRAEADEEARFVARHARSRGLPFSIARVRVPRQASLQQAARNVRLAALSSLAAKHRLARIALGHTRSDQAETVLLRVIRGTGPRGLAGIPPKRGRFVRPLLATSRPEIEAYLRERRIPSIRDASNLDRRFARVRVRLDVLPVLRELNPRIEQALARLAGNARRERSGFASPPLTHAHLQTLAGLLLHPGGTSWLSLPGGKMAEVRILSSRRIEAPPAIEIRVSGLGRYAIPALGVALVLRRRRQPPRRVGGAWFAAESLAFPLQLRTRRPGDRIALDGGTKKVAALLIDAKVPRRDRGATLLLCDGARVLWVVGSRQASGTRPQSKAGIEAWVTRPRVRAGRRIRELS